MTNDALAADRDARRASMTEFDRPLVLEAGAGTGKTTTLVNRVLAWTLGRGWDEIANALPEGESEDGDEQDGRERIAAAVLDGVTAITFTEAAAAEMAARVAAGLAAIVERRPDELPGFDTALGEIGSGDLVEQRATALLGQLELLEVSTIHAFCHRLLTSHPLELGLHPSFRIDGEAREIEATVREIVESAVRAEYASDASALLDAAALGLGPRELCDALVELSTHALPATELEGDPFAPERMAGFCADLAQRVREFLTVADGRLETVTRGANAKLVAEALGRTLELLSGLDTAHTGAAAELCSAIEVIWPPKLIDRIGQWQSEKFTKSELDALGDRAELLRPLAGALQRILKHLTGLDPERTRAFRAAIQPLLAKTEEALRSKGLTYFSHILIEARRLLATSPEILAAERHRLHQLLVDEFQDTDPVQCDIVGMLAFGDASDDNPGLFIVGDPKQSIFGWRSADLAAYQGFVDRVRDHEGKVYELVTNFRSAPIILDEVAHTVAAVMHEEHGLQPAFTPLAPSEKTRSATGFRHGRWAPIEGWVVCSLDALASGARQITANEARELEADAVARDIADLAATCQVELKDIGVLLRQQTSLDILLEAFRRRGVRYVVTGDRKYFQRREIIDAAALVRTIIDPTDQVALLTWMRSPSVGVPDAALIPLWRHGFPEAMIAPFAGDLEALVRRAVAETPSEIPGLDRLAGWEESLLAAAAGIADLRRSFREECSDAFIERLRRSTLIEAHEAARFLGQYRVANLDRFFRHLHVAIDETRGNVQEVLRALRRSVSDSRDAQEALPREAAEDAVQVMTIHKAKGLEFRHVYLLDLDAGRGRNKRSLTEAEQIRSDGRPREYVLHGGRTLGFPAMEERRQMVEEAERVRLLYVAMTRARERLVLSGGWGVRRSQESFTSLLTERPGLPASWPHTAGEAASGPGWVDLGGIRWKFPVPTDDVDEHVPEPRVEALPTRAELERAARQLATLAGDARERMRRPLFTAASDRERAPAPASEPGELGGGRTTAQAVGHAIHAALERWDLEADPEVELARQRPRVLDSVRTDVASHDLDAAVERTERLLERLRTGRLLQRLHGLGDRIVGREVPVVLAAGADQRGPLGGYSGIADLVVRSDQDDRLLVIDYKTDAVDAGAAMQVRAEEYSPQVQIYARALEEALGLDYRPRCEIWFLWPDCVWSSS